MAQIPIAQAADARSDLRGIALAAAAAVAFGTLAISAKYAYDAGAGPLPLLAGRFILATALLAGLRAAKHNKRTTTREEVVRLMLLGGLGYALESALFFAALENAPAGVVGLVFYSYPMWTALIALATRLEPFRVRLLVALGLGSTGIALVFSVPQTGLKGPALALGAALAVAIYLVAIQVWASGVEATSSALWTSAGAAVALLVAAPLSGQPLPAGALGPAAALGLASATAFVLLYAAIERLGSSRTAVATMLEPVATVLLAALVLNEPITARIAVGAVLVVAALPVLALRRREPQVDVPPLA